MLSFEHILLFDLQIKTDPLGGLMKLLELGQSKKTNVSNAQRLELLRRAFTVQSNANITDMFVEVQHEHIH